MLRSVCSECSQGPVDGRTFNKPRTSDAILKEALRERELKAVKAERETLAKELDRANRRQSVLDELRPAKIPSIKPVKVSKERRLATAVLLCSDWHIGEVVEADRVNGLNEYNLDVAAKRIDKLIEGVFWLVEMYRSKFEISSMILWLGGDLMTGYIHEDLVESNSLSPIEEVLWLQEKLSMMLMILKKEFPDLIAQCSPGNHGRTTEKKRVHTGSENSYEYLLYRNLATLHPNIDIRASRGQIDYVQVYDTMLRFTHGDIFRYGGGVGGYTIPINKAIARLDQGKHADVTCFGHFHQYADLPDMVGNGSMIGHSMYAVEIAAPFEEPQQAFFLIDSKRGKCCATPIWLDDRK